MRARIVAPLAAALLGSQPATATALVTNDDPDPGGGPAAIQDPLGLAIPMVRLDCTPGHGLLVLGFGDTSPPLRAAQADNPREELSYVDVDPSCDTIYGPERQNPPAYAVVLGPFDDLSTPCPTRMLPEHRGDSSPISRAATR